jgi:hypothetical protein
VPRIAVGRTAFGTGFTGFKEHSTAPFGTPGWRGSRVSAAPVVRRAVPRAHLPAGPNVTPAPRLNRGTSPRIPERHVIDRRPGIRTSVPRAVPGSMRPPDSPYERARRVMETPRRPDGTNGRPVRSMPSPDSSSRTIGAPGLRSPSPSWASSFGQPWQRHAAPRATPQRVVPPPDSRPAGPGSGMVVPPRAPASPRIAAPRPAPSSVAGPRSRGEGSAPRSAAPRGGERGASSRGSGARRR